MQGYLKVTAQLREGTGRWVTRLGLGAGGSRAWCVPVGSAVPLGRWRDCGAGQDGAA